MGRGVHGHQEVQRTLLEGSLVSVLSQHLKELRDPGSLFLREIPARARPR